MLLNVRTLILKENKMLLLFVLWLLSQSGRQKFIYIRTKKQAFLIPPPPSLFYERKMLVARNIVANLLLIADVLFKKCLLKIIKTSNINYSQSKFQ